MHEVKGAAESGVRYGRSLFLCATCWRSILPANTCEVLKEALARRNSKIQARAQWISMAKHELLSALPLPSRALAPKLMVALALALFLFFIGNRRLLNYAGQIL